MKLGAAIAKFTSRGAPHPVEGQRRINKRQGLLFEEPEAVTANCLATFARRAADGASPVWLESSLIAPYPGIEGKPTLSCDSLCLFSGGLDSLTGAIDLLSAGKRVGLIGHHGAGMTNAVQGRTLDVLDERYKDAVSRLMFYVQPPKRKLKDGEPSMRSRSFLFLSLGVATATALGSSMPLTVAENGLISVNVPLTPSRIGSSATRTTHPHFIDLYSAMLKTLRLTVAFDLPYKFKTKGEMLAETRDQDCLKKISPLTMSCSHSEAGRYHGFTPGNHCRYCVPCIIRRAAMAHAKLDDAKYNVEVRKNPPDYQTEGGRDFRAFEMAIERFSGTTNRDSLASVMATGPLPPDHIKDYAAVYRRGMEEVTRFLRSRP
jgi:7-cyano-7-deazaguanine synthase in queuosine biosynthesis